MAVATQAKLYPQYAARLPDQTEIAERDRIQFDCQGFIILRGVLNQEEVNRLKLELSRLEELEYDDSEWIDDLSHPTKSIFAEATRLNGLPRLSSAFDSIIGHNAVRPYLHAFLNQPMLVNTWYINKQQGKGSVGWHSGIDAFRHFSYNNQAFTSMLNMIWALDENNEETGCPIALPGSHKRSFNFKERYDLLEMPGSIPVILHPGDVFLFSEATMHGGLPRKAPGSRKNLYINYVDGNTGVTNSDGNLHHYWLPEEVRARFPEDKQALFKWMRYSVGA